MSRPGFDHLRVPAHLAEHEDDDQAGQRGYIKATDYSLPYTSSWSRLHDAEVDTGLFRHVNCTYLSTHGVPPTLLALKQHAQSLCALILQLSPTLEPGEIGIRGGQNRDGDDDKDGTEDPLAVRYRLNDAFDFLDDLSTPYDNNDPDHHRPLLALVNEVRSRDEARGVTHYHCPLAAAEPPRSKGGKIRPYASHHNLVLHANACLERLDHEFSPTGGLMSLLPVVTPLAGQKLVGDDDDDGGNDNGPGPHRPPAVDPALPHPDLANARNSLLGQWLHFTQALVARTHDLERAYGAALDVLAGEATVPHELLASGAASSASGGGGGGRPLVYPQDRWILAHAGDAVFELVHSLLDRQEALARSRERALARNGAVGDGAGFADKGGLVYVDVATRYYRVAPPTGSGESGGGGSARPAQHRSTLFVLPAWEHHPGVAHTRAAESRPTIVACPSPKWPARATELEKRYEDHLRRAQQTQVEDARLRLEVQEKTAELRLLAAENERLARARDALLLAVGDDGLLVETAERMHEIRESARKAKTELAQAQRERDEGRAREKALEKRVEALRTQVARLEAARDAKPSPGS
ncbi:hypothetical protein VTJ83DRAFT_4281 [Remersonia thermophila]|uniref:Uncharacterized protein n=1 Tax=Remersonia thermophila TaxID=72144 RepID=A0ABR4DAF2_9PEZI